MSTGSPPYAEDPSLAEQGPDYRINNPPEPNNIFAKYSLPNARVWSHYLDETKGEDKNRVQLWKTRVDQTFEVVFATILAAFAVESSKGFEDNPQRQEISRNESSTFVSFPFHPSNSSSYLWLISSVLTLFDVLWAGLAKGWIDTYQPASMGKSSSDACQRYLRATGARQWHLDGVLAIIPLVVEIAFIIYLIGLVTDIFRKGLVIGTMVLILTALTIFLYVAATVLSWFSPASPYRTPLSPSANGRAWHKQKATEAMVLECMLANSTEDGMAEAIKALAGLDNDRICFKQLGLVKSIGGAVPRILEVFEDKDLEICHATVTALGKFFAQSGLNEAIDIAMQRIVKALEDNDSKVRSSAVNALGECSKQQKLIPAIATYAVPSIVKALEDEDSQVRCSAVIALGDFSKQSGLVQHIKNAVLGTVKALEDKSLDVRRSAITTLIAFSEQSGLMKRINETLPYIGMALDHPDRNARLSVAPAICKFSEHSGLLEAIEIAMPRIVKALHCTNDSETCCSAFNVIGKLSKQPRFVEAIKIQVPFIIGALDGDKLDIRDSAITTLIAFSQQLDLAAEIKGAVPIIFQLLDNPGLIWEGRHLALIALGEFSKRPGLLEVNAVPRIVKALEDKNLAVRDSVSTALVEISKNSDLVDEMKEAVRNIVNLLDVTDSEVRRSALTALGELSKQQGLIPETRNAVPSIVKALEDECSQVRRSAVTALSEFSKQPGLLEAIKNTMPSIVKAHEDESLDVRYSAVIALTEISRQQELASPIDNAQHS